VLIAVTRPVSPSFAECELTWLVREPIDVGRAVAQHQRYERLLGTLGATVVQAAAAPDHPDAVFVEDAAIVLDEVAVLTRPGAASRRGELPGIELVLAPYRPVVTMTAPATLDGGDVLRLGRVLYVGLSQRTSPDGVEQLRRLVAPHDYRVVAVAFSGCLHLKSAVTDVGDGRLLHNPAWVSAAAFPDCEVIEVDAREPYGANALRISGGVVYPAEHPRTAARLRERGVRVASVECDELAKAEGAVTCCSLLFPPGVSSPVDSRPPGS
jgi:dimethylargininase